MTDVKYFKLFRYPPMKPGARAKGPTIHISFKGRWLPGFSFRKWRRPQPDKRYRILQAAENLCYLSEELEPEEHSSRSGQNGLYSTLSLTKVKDEFSPVCLILYLDDGVLKLLINQTVEAKFKNVEVQRDESGNFRILQQPGAEELFSARQEYAYVSIGRSRSSSVRGLGSDMPDVPVDDSFVKYLVHLQSPEGKEELAQLRGAWSQQLEDPRR